MAKVPSNTKIHQSENFLRANHNTIAGFESIEDFVVEGENCLDDATYNACLYHLKQIRIELAKVLWKSERYIGISLIDDLVFQCAKDLSKPIFTDAYNSFTTSVTRNVGFVLYPLHGFGLEIPSLFGNAKALNPYIHFRGMGVCLTHQQSEFASALKSVRKMATKLHVQGKIGEDSLWHYFRSRNLRWLTTNPLMMVNVVSHTGDYYENQFVYTLKIRIVATMTAMLHSIAVDKGKVVDEFSSSAVVNNEATLDIKHYIIGETRNVCGKSILELRSVPMHVSAIDLARLSDLPVTVSSEILKLKSISQYKTKLGITLKQIESGHMAYVNLSTGDKAKKRMFARLVTALDWFRYSFGGRATNSEAIVNLAIAFETLLTDHYSGGVADRVERRVKICLKHKKGLTRYLEAVRSVMSARGEIVHTGSTMQQADIEKARAAFAYCVAFLGKELPKLRSNSHNPIGSLLGDV